MNEPKSFGERLAAQDWSDDADARQRRRKSMMEALEEEKATVRRIRIICLTAWGLVLVLPLFLVSLLTATNRFTAPALMVVAPLFSGIGTVALVVAVIATGALFFRSRSVTLASIDARLQYLEELLGQRDQSGT